MMQGQKSLFDDQPEPDHWAGMPEFVQEKKQEYAKLIVRFRNEADLQEFAALIGQKLNRKSQCTWHPELKRGELGNSGKCYVDESSLSGLHRVEGESGEPTNRKVA